MFMSRSMNFTVSYRALLFLVVQIFFAYPGSLVAQTPELVLDINTFDDTDYNIDHFYLFKKDSLIYFEAGDGIHGKELWVTDGTSEGTRMLKDINIGYQGSLPSGFVPYQGKLYFNATDGVHGHELWVTDGTSSGTHMVKDIQPGNWSSFPVPLLEINAKLLLLANNQTYGMEFWVSDGTESGTVLLDDFTPGPDGIGVGNRILFNGKMYFSRNTLSQGHELWVTDGTVLGTYLIKDIDTVGANSQIENFFIHGDSLYFLADDGIHGTELWVTGGTEETTYLRYEMRTGSENGVSTAKSHLDFIYLAGLNDAGYAKFMRLNPLNDSTGIILDSSTYYPGELYSADSTLVFSFVDNGLGRELWKYLPTEDSLIMIKDINPNSGNSGPEEYLYVDSMLYFQAFNGTFEEGDELWISDLTDSGTFLLKDIYRGYKSSNPQQLIEYFGKVIFKAKNENGEELWVTDGTTEGTVMLKNISLNTASSHPQDLYSVGDSMLYFRANGLYNDGELWMSKGDSASTKKVKKFDYGYGPTKLHSAGNKLYFIANGQELWQTTIGSFSTNKIAFTGFNYQEPYNYNYTSFKGKYYFTGILDNINDDEIFYTEGVSSTNLIDLHTGGFSSRPDAFGILNDQLYFSLFDGSAFWLYKSNGTDALIVRQIRNKISEFCRFDGSLYFPGGIGDEGIELCYTTGDEENTNMAVNIFGGSESSNPSYLTVVDDIMFFAARNDYSGSKLFGYRGLSTPLFEIPSGMPYRFRYPRNLVKSKSRLYFTAEDSLHGRELWTIDLKKLDEGAKMVKDIYLGPTGSSIDYMVDVYGTLYFRASDGINWSELWRSDGTDTGTYFIDLDTLNGSGASYLTVMGNALYFQADDNTLGAELWKITVPCETANKPVVTYTDSILCYNDTATITIQNSTELNDAYYWFLYDAEDPNLAIDSTEEGTFLIYDQTKSSKYNIRGGGGCPDFGDPESIQIASKIDVNIDSLKNVSCFSYQDGSVSVSATGNLGPVLYGLDSSMIDLGNVIQDLSSGDYIIWAKDSSGCMGVSSTITIKEPKLLELEISNLDSTEGTITLSASGGTTPYQYSLDGLSYQIENSFKNLEQKLYTVYVEDKNGCIDTVDFEILLSTNSELEYNFRIFPNPTTDRVFFKGMPPQTHLEIYNGIGSLVARITKEGYCDLSDWSTGVYVLNAVHADKGVIFTRMLVVE